MKTARVKSTVKKRSTQAFLNRSSFKKKIRKERCQELFDLTHDLIQIFTPRGAFLEVNPVWKRKLGYDEKDLASISVFNLLHSRDKKEAAAVFESVCRDGKPRKLFATLLAKNGEKIAIDGVLSRIAWQGKTCALQGVFGDVTEHKQYDELKDEFISTISHELRTPLTVVREGIAQILDGLMGKVTEKQSSLLGMVLQNTDRLGRIIEELLDVSKLEAGRVRIHRSLYNIVEVGKEVVHDFQPIARKKNVDIKVISEKNSINIYIDRGKIIQVLTNLINNACKFTAQGHIRVHFLETKDFVECRVADTGRGISQEDLPMAFEKFRQFAKEVGPGEKGTGLGLSICKKLVELHHGRVAIKSFPMKGTTVSFLLPKYTPREIFKEAIAQALEKCEDKQRTLSVIVFDLVDFHILKKNLGDKRLEQIVWKMERLLNESLRRAADIAIKDTQAILVLLPDTKKENAYIVLGRLYQVLLDYFSHEQLSSQVEIRSSVTCFPEEAHTIEKILDKIYD